jgi:RNA polymerase sigma factor (sigma-70 family)
VHFIANHSNQQLFQSIAEGNHSAFDLLFTRFQPQLIRAAIKWSKSADAANDIVQETFLGLWTSREKLMDVQDPQAYIYTSLFYTINRWLRQETNRKKILSLPWAESVNNTEIAIDAKDSQELINKALQQLPAQKQLVYHLKKEEGHSHAEIAEMLQLSPHTVKSYLKETIKFMRSYLKNAAMGLFSLMF